MMWLLTLVVFFAMLFLLMSFGVGVAMAFLIVNICTLIYFVGVDSGMSVLVTSSYGALAHYVLSPIPLFILMGEILYRSGCISMALDAMERMLGRLPGRLSLLSILAGTVFAATSGSTVANASMLGSTLVPEMLRRNYRPTMAIGPIIGSGSLAMIIPPSGIAVLLGGIAHIPVADLLVGGVVPGLLMALLFFMYVLLRCAANPALAPVDADAVVAESFGRRLMAFVTYVLPLGILVAVVLGAIMFGIATPTESASLGVVAALVIAALYGRLRVEPLRKALVETVMISSSILLIVALATGFAQALSLSGATRAMLLTLQGFDVSATTIVIMMLLVVLVLGMFLEIVAVMLVCMPLFMPVVATYGIDPVWFGLMVLLCLDIGQLTPPFGMLLFVMRSVVPDHISYGTIVLSAVPFIIMELAILALIFLVPEISLFLPGLME